MRGIGRDVLRGDSGMTLVEIIVASVMLFVILTGVLGLVATTTTMSVAAKQQNVLTNVVSGYVEWLHSLPFGQVALVGDGEGVLGPTDPAHPEYSRHNRSVGEFQIAVTPSVVPRVGTVDLKDVTISVTVTRSDGFVQSMSTTVVIRDRSRSLLEGNRDPATDPVASFGLGTPPELTVVWDSLWGNSAPLYLYFRAKAAEGRTIDRARVTIGGYPIADTDGKLADFEDNSDFGDIGVNEWTSAAFRWDTKHETLGDDGTPYRTFPDGRYQLTLRVWDDYNIEGRSLLWVIINNDRPDAPEYLIAPTSPAAPNPEIEWARVAVVDRFGAPAGYELEIRRQTIHDTGSELPFPPSPSEWPVVGGYEGPGTGFTMASEPFSRYAARVSALSPRYFPPFDDASFRSDWVESPPFVTRPLVTGSYSILRVTSGVDKHFTTTSALAVSEPGFPTAAGSVSYRWYRSVNGGPFVHRPGLVGSSVTDSYKQTEGVSSNNSPYHLIRYRVEVDYALLGAAEAVETIESNTVVTTNSTVSNTPFTEGAW